jgi:hypothetical protein
MQDSLSTQAIANQISRWKKFRNSSYNCIPCNFQNWAKKAMQKTSDHGGRLQNANLANRKRSEKTQLEP